LNFTGKVRTNDAFDSRFVVPADIDAISGQGIDSKHDSRRTALWRETQQQTGNIISQRLYLTAHRHATKRGWRILLQAVREVP
jgi:hypothetical protein